MEIPVYTVKEFAKIMQMHPNTIRKAIKSGKITAFKIGKGPKSEWRILHSEIERLISYDMKEIIDRLVVERLKNEK